MYKLVSVVYMPLANLVFTRKYDFSLPLLLYLPLTAALWSVIELYPTDMNLKQEHVDRKLTLTVVTYKLNLVTCMTITISSWNPTYNQVGISNSLHLDVIKFT